MNRRELVGTVASEMFSPGSFVTYPDHPLLGRGPDVLGKDAHGLVALFIYSQVNDHVSSRQERSRLLLSRFALAEGTRFVALAAPESEIDSIYLFDEIRFRSERGALSDSEQLGSHAAAIVEQLRPLHNARFSDAWAPHHSSPPTQGRYGESTFSLGNEGHVRQPEWVEATDNHLVARIDRRRAPMPKVQQLAASMVAADYGLSDGLPGLERVESLLVNRDAHLALHKISFGPPGLPTHVRTGDPQKAARVAAFAGARLAGGLQS